MNSTQTGNDQYKLSFFLFLTGNGLWLFAFQQIVLTTALFYTGCSIQHNQLYFHIVAQTILVYFLFKKFSLFSLKLILLSLVLQLLIFWGAVLFEKEFYDTSYDGQTYHQKGIIDLKKGYNPIFQEHSDPLLKHYPKGCWIPGAIVYDATGNIEASKYVNLYYAIAFFLVCWYSFSMLYQPKGLIRHLVTFLVVVSISFHPVISMKLFNSYADGQLTALLGIMLCNFMLAIRQSKYFNLAIVSGLVMCTIKFTGIVYLLIFVAGFLGWQYFEKQPLREYIHYKKAVLLLLLAIGMVYHPLIENTLFYGHAFFPANVLGTDNLLPVSMKDNNRFVNTFICLFAKPENVNNTTTIPELSIPFTQVPLWPYEGNVDIFAAFGPFFSGVFVLCFVLFVLLCIVEKSLRLKLVCAVLLLSFSVFVNPGCWWFRWVPQLYWLVLLPCLFAVYTKRRILILLGVSILLFSVYNAFFFSRIVYQANVLQTQELKKQLEVLSHFKLLVDTCVCSSNVERLNAYNMEYSFGSCKSGEQFNMYYAPCFKMQPNAVLETDTLLSLGAQSTKEEYFIFAEKVTNYSPGFFYITGKVNAKVFIVLSGEDGYYQYSEIRPEENNGFFNLKLEAPYRKNILKIYLWNPDKKSVRIEHAEIVRKYYH